jgi:hypothetical protein
MVLGSIKPFLLIVIASILIAGIGVAQYGSQPSNGYGMTYSNQGYGTGTQQNTGYGAQSGQGQQYPQSMPQSGGYGMQPQQGYNQPMQQEGYGSNMAIASTGFASSVSGFENYRFGFERGIRTEDPTSFANHLLFVSFRIALAKNKERFNLDEKCQTESGEAEVANLLVAYYNSGGKELAGRILDNRKLMLADLCSEDACSKQFSSNEFVRNAPPEVRKAIQNDPSLQFDATTSAAELKTKIQRICEAVVKTEFTKQQTHMEKKISQMTNQFKQQCTYAEQQKQQMEKQQQEWQRREGITCGMGQEPYWDETGTKHCRQSMGNQPSQGQGPPPQCEFGWNMNNGYYQCNPAPGGNTGGAGQQPPQGPFCGDGICNEDPATCVGDCGQQGGGGQPESPPTGGDNSGSSGGEGSGTTEGGGLAMNVWNQMFGNHLVGFTALASMLQLQGFGGQKCPDGLCDEFEQANPGMCPQDCGSGSASSGGSNSQCPPGEYWGINDQGMQSCIAGGTSGEGYGMSSGAGGYNQPAPPQGRGLEQGYNQPPQSGYNMPAQGGGYGGGMGGPGFGDYAFEEMCENPEEKIREQFSGEMEGREEEMSTRCADEASRKTQEILMHSEEVLLRQTECMADTAEMCSETTAVVEALEKALNNIQEPANQIAKFECTRRRLTAQAEATRNEMSQAALELASITETGQFGQEGLAAGGAAAMGIINKDEAIAKSKQEAGFMRWFIESPAVKEAQKAAAEALEKNLATVEDLEEQGNLSPDQQQKLETVKQKMLAAKTKATGCQGTIIFPSIFGC